MGRRDISDLALASFFMGIAGLFIYGVLFGILAMIFGGISLAKIHRGYYRGGGLALVGIILGIIDIILLVMLSLLYPDLILNI